MSTSFARTAGLFVSLLKKLRELLDFYQPFYSNEKNPISLNSNKMDALSKEANIFSVKFSCDIGLHELIL